MTTRTVPYIASALTAVVLLGDPSAGQPSVIRREVSFESLGATIQGVLLLPRSNAPVPATMVLPGDGPSVRSDRLLEEVGESLAKVGIAVLLVDKRGCGKSTGVLGDATTQVLADDAVAAFRFLSSQEQIANQKIGIVGHSEGALIGVMAAAQAPVSFLVLMGYPVIGLRETMHSQRGLHLKGIGASDLLIAHERRFWNAVFDAIRNGDDEDGIKRSASADSLMTTRGLLLEYERLDLPSPEGVLKESLSELESPWFRFLLSYKPEVDLKKVGCPILALYGSADAQVSPEQNVSVLRETFFFGQVDERSVQVLPELDHHFREVPTGEGAVGPETSPAALRIIEKWIREITGGM